MGKTKRAITPPGGSDLPLEKSAWLRLFHWGPATALSIIKCIVIMTLYMNSMWWPPNTSFAAFLNQIVFIALSSATTFNFFMATVVGPGLLPRKWQPKDPLVVKNLQYCNICEGYKAPRSHHCRKCNRCVKKMDHHCPWINNCVGWSNHGYFISFLIFAILGSLQGGIILSCAFCRGIYRYWYIVHDLAHLATVYLTMSSLIICILAMGLALGVVISLSMLLYFQIKSIVCNKTGIEIWIVEKAKYRRLQYKEDHDDLDIQDNLLPGPFIYPYDLGWRENICQVFSVDYTEKEGGIEWPVKDGCDQYTLTREQIAQKNEKRLRTKTYSCRRPATGRCFPLFSQGLRVCLSTPCTDEPRIHLEPGDVIRVTRFRRHWLFGERVYDATTALERTGPIRGWFPRQCAIEIQCSNVKETVRLDVPKIIASTQEGNTEENQCQTMTRRRSIWTTKSSSASSNGYH